MRHGDHRRRPGRPPRLPTRSAVRAVRAPHAEDIVRPRRRQLHARHRVRRVRRSIASTSTRTRCTSTTAPTLGYDVLIVATGARLVPEETEGLTGPGWMENVFTFYTPRAPRACARTGSRFRRRPRRRQRRRHADQVSGRAARVLLPRRLVLPRARHPRPTSSITYVTPLDGAFTKPVAAATLGGHARPRRASSSSPSSTPARSTARAASSFRTTAARSPFDLAVVVPLHGGAAYVGRSPGLGDELNFVPDRRAHAAVEGRAEHLRDRRRGERAGVEGRVR